VLGLTGSLLSFVCCSARFGSFDPYAFAAVSILVLLAGLPACFVHAAARVDPISALRHE
jgi:hypothetical protein